MITKNIVVNKASVYNEVEKTTSYAGVKIDDLQPQPRQQDEQTGTSAYDRIRTTDSDREMLERYWTEACNRATDRLKDFITETQDYSEGHGVALAKNFDITLSLSSSWDTDKTQSISLGLYSFFVYYICAKWFGLSNKEEADTYLQSAENELDKVMRAVYYRKKPTRQTNNNQQ